MTQLLTSIKNTILEHDQVESCLIYPNPRGEIIAPAVFLEIANYGIGDDPATDELALVANLEARVVVDSTIENAEIACQTLACEIASTIHLAVKFLLQRFLGLHEISSNRILICTSAG